MPMRRVHNIITCIRSCSRSDHNIVSAFVRRITSASQLPTRDAVLRAAVHIVVLLFLSLLLLSIIIYYYYFYNFRLSLGYKHSEHARQTRFGIPVRPSTLTPKLLTKRNITRRKP